MRKILPEGLGDAFPECLLVRRAEASQTSDDERLLKGGEDGLDGGRLQQSGRLPLANPDLPLAGVGRN